MELFESVVSHSAQGIRDPSVLLSVHSHYAHIVPFVTEQYFMVRM